MLVCLREVIKQAFHHELILDGQIWIEMLDERNLMTYAYQEEAALAAVKSIRERYIDALEHIYQYLLGKKK